MPDVNGAPKATVTPNVQEAQDGIHAVVIAIRELTAILAPN